MRRKRARSLRLDAYNLIVATVVFTTVSRLHQRYALLVAIHPVQLLYAAALTLAFVNNSRVRWSNLWGSRVARWVWLMVALAVVSVPLSIHARHSFEFLIGEFAAAALLFVLVLIGVRDARDARTYLWGYVLGMGSWVWLTLTVLGMRFVGGTVGRLDTTYRMTYDPNDLALVLIVGIPFCVYLMRTQRGIGRWLAGAILLGSAYVISQTGSRGGFVAFIVVLALLLFSWRSLEVSKRIMVAAATVVGLAIAVPAGYWDRMATVLRPMEDYNWTAQEGRLEVAKRGLGYMLRRPPLGTGIDTFSIAEGTISEKAKNYVGGPLRWTAPHNSFVQVGAELGIIGLAAMLWLFIHAWRTTRPRSPPIGSGRLAESAPPADDTYSDSLRIAFCGFALGALFLSFGYSLILYFLAGLLGSFEGMLTGQPALSRSPRQLAVARRHRAP